MLGSIAGTSQWECEGVDALFVRECYLDDNGRGTSLFGVQRPMTSLWRISRLNSCRPAIFTQWPLPSLNNTSCYWAAGLAPPEARCPGQHPAMPEPGAGVPPKCRASVVRVHLAQGTTGGPSPRACVDAMPLCALYMHSLALSPCNRVNRNPYLHMNYFLIIINTSGS